MNTMTTITSRLAFGTAIAALCFGAAACGTEGGTTEQGTEQSRSRPAEQSRISPRAAEHQAELEEQARIARAERAEALRWARGESQCHSNGHPTRGLDCNTTQPDEGSGSTRPGSHKYPDLIP